MIVPRKRSGTPTSWAAPSIASTMYSEKAMKTVITASQRIAPHAEHRLLVVVGLGLVLVQVLVSVELEEEVEAYASSIAATTRET